MVQKKIVSCYPSAARTASPAAMQDQSSSGSKGIVVVIDTTVLPGADVSNVFTIQGKDPISGKYYTILASAVIAGLGTVILRVYPGLTAAANLVANDVLPAQWRVIVVAGNGNSATYSVGASLIP